MRRLSSTQGRNTDLPALDTDRRSAAIAAMGYRLAAAGPRTRQRLIERETAAPPAPLRAEPHIAVPSPITEPMPALASWDDAWWEQRLATDAELGMARLSQKPGRFPIWRALALLTSAACGFSLVLFGQSLHLDRKLRQANRQPAPALVSEARQPAPPPDQLPLPAAAPASPKPPPQSPALAQAAPSPPEPAQAPSAPPDILPASIPAGQRMPHPAQPSFAGLARPPLAHTTARLVLAMATRPPVPKPAQQKPHQAAPRHDLPRWLTEDRPQHERELIMSPPPHNLDAPAGAELAANAYPAAPRNDLPPLPKPARAPTLIYAEAHSAPPPATYSAAPRPTYNPYPYPYPPYPQTYGYYGAMPPPTPYGAP